MVLKFLILRRNIKQLFFEREYNFLKIIIIGIYLYDSLSQDGWRYIDSEWQYGLNCRKHENERS